MHSSVVGEKTNQSKLLAMHLSVQTMTNHVTSSYAIAYLVEILIPQNHNMAIHNTGF
jgi:hypothetical protein